MFDGQPPVLSEKQQYDQWRRDIEGWINVTDVEPRRQAFTVRLKLEGIYRKFALALDAADLNQENGMMFLLEKLDEVFGRKDKEGESSSKSKGADRRNLDSEDGRINDDGDRRSRDIGDKRNRDNRNKISHDDGNSRNRDGGNRKQRGGRGRRNNTDGGSRNRDGGDRRNLDDADRRRFNDRNERDFIDGDENILDDRDRRNRDDIDRRLLNDRDRNIQDDGDRERLDDRDRRNSIDDGRRVLDDRDIRNPGDGNREIVDFLDRRNPDIGDRRILEDRDRRNRDDGDRRIIDIRDRRNFVDGGRRIFDDRESRNPGDGDREILDVRDSRHPDEGDRRILDDRDRRNSEDGNRRILDVRDSRNFIDRDRRILDISDRGMPNDGDSRRFGDMDRTNENEERGEDDNGERYEHDNLDETLSGAEKAKLRAQKLSDKLAAEGKYQTPPMSLLPNAAVNPVDQFKKPGESSSSMLPQVKRLDNGGYFAEFDINDVPARVFLVRLSTQELISSQSGAALTLKGRYLNAEEKRKSVITGANEKALTIMIEADVAAKVLVALHKLKEVIARYEKQGPNSHNNYGLTGPQAQNSYHFVQRKIFVGCEQFHKDFDVIKQLLGEEGTNLNFIVRQTGAKVFLRGRGSGYLEQNSGKESFEAMHVYVSHPDQAGLDSASQLCESLIESVKVRYHEFEQNQFIMKHQMAYHQQPQYNVVIPSMPRPTYPQQQFIGNPNMRPPMHPPQRAPPPGFPMDQQRPPFQQRPPMQQPIQRPPMEQQRPPLQQQRPPLQQQRPPMQQQRPPLQQQGPNLQQQRPPFQPPQQTPMQRPTLSMDVYGGDHMANNDFYRDDMRNTGPPHMMEQNFREENEQQNFERKDRSRQRPRSRSRSPRSKSDRSRSPRPRSPRNRSPRPYDNQRTDSPRQMQGSYSNSPNRIRSPNRINGRVSGRSPSRSPPRDRKNYLKSEDFSRPGRSDSRERDREKKHQESPERKKDRRKEESPERKKDAPPRRRRFTEEPKKKRRFCEDPKLLEKTKSVEVTIRRVEEMPMEERPSPKLQFRSSKRESKPKDDEFLPPPPIFPTSEKNEFNKPTSRKEIVRKSSLKKEVKFKDERIDMFKPPEPISIIKASPAKALKIGALSTLNAYGDSDEEEN